MESSSTYHHHSSHVDFVTSEGGTTIGEILKILFSISMTPLLASLFLPWAVPPKFIYHATKDSCFYIYVKAITEYPFIVVLPLWLVTVLAGENGLETTNYSSIIWIVLLSACFGIMVVNYAVTQPKWEGFFAFWEKIKDKPLNSSVPFSGLHPVNKTEQDEKKRKSSDGVDKIKYPFITNYRAIVIYVTVIAILAVDFPIFPRRYAKTKKYGYSLMDIGTGSFLFMNGIIAPEAKGRKSNLLKSCISTLPLVIIGLVRLISVKGIEYHEVVEEYGVHWNFFFTLASVKLLSSSIFTWVDPAFSFKLSCTVGFLYEYFLVKNSMLEDYILNENTQRYNFIDANREGLFSVWGYLTIYLASVYVGKVIYCMPSVTIKEWLLYSCRSLVHISLLWIALQVSTSYGSKSCRRAANLSYSLWILATNYTILWVFATISLLQAVVQHLGLLHGPLISYELKSLMEPGHQKIKKLNQQFKKYSCSGESTREEEMETTLSQLEDKLKEFQQSGNPSIYCEVTTIIKHLEEELSHIGAQIEGEIKEEDKKTDPQSSEKNLILMPDLTKSPVTLEAICYNGLAVFLLGNLLTGLVNCIMQTIYVPNYLALCYLWAYASIISTFSVIMYMYNIQLKFW